MASDMVDERVCIIFSPAYGPRLKSIDDAIPAWIIESPTNDPVVAELWALGAVKITSFRPQGFEQLFDTVDQHHPGWRQLEVIGVTVEDGASALSEFQGTIAQTKDGFFFIRR